MDAYELAPLHDGRGSIAAFQGRVKTLSTAVA